MNMNSPAWPDSLPTQKLMLNTGASPSSLGSVLEGMPYKLLADGALLKQGMIDGTGQIPIDHHVAVQGYKLEFANGVTHDIPVPVQYRGDAANGELANQGVQFHEAAADADTAKVDRAVHRQNYGNLLNSGLEP